MTGKPEFKPMSPFKIPTAAVDTCAEQQNIPSTVFPQSGKKPKLVSVKKEAAEPVSEWVTVTLKIPESVDRQLKRKAFDDRCTNQAVVLKALAAYGIDVPSEAMVDDRRRKNRSAF
jgi:hypothetical protein